MPINTECTFASKRQDHELSASETRKKPATGLPEVELYGHIYFIPNQSWKTKMLSKV